MNKAKTRKSKGIIITVGIIMITTIMISAFILNHTNKYVGAYNLDDRYSIILKQDGTCDFTEFGVSAYINTELKCFYKVNNTDVTIERDVRRYKWVYGGSSSWGDVWKPGAGCIEYSNKPGECNEEIVRIQETAIIGDTGMIYKDKVYIKLK